MTNFIHPPSTILPGSIVWDYLRDSGGNRQELSVSQQSAEVEAFCSTFHLIHGRSFHDIAKTGTTDAGRDSFFEMIDLIRKNTKDDSPVALLIWNHARFARDFDDAQYYKAAIRRKGIVIHSLTDPIPDHESGKLIEIMIDYVNQEKSRQTSIDSKRGLQNHVLGGYSSGGTPPRCYLSEAHQISTYRNGEPRMGSKWIPDPDLWELGKLAWKWRAEGRSYQEITKLTGGRLFTNSGSWSTFFSNNSYLGIGKCGTLEVPNHHPALVDQETWERVQSIRKSHPRHNGDSQNKLSPRSRNMPSLLSGLAYCEHCGSTLSHQTYYKNNSFWRCYICGQKSRKNWKACPSRMINAKGIETVVLHTVFNQILTHTFYTELVNRVQANLMQDNGLDMQIADLTRSLPKLDKSIQRLLDALEHGNISDIQTRLSQRTAERDAVRSKIKVLEKQRKIDQLIISPEAIKSIFDEWKVQIAQGLANQDLLCVREVLKKFIHRIESGYDFVKIYYRYPIKNPSFPEDYLEDEHGSITLNTKNTSEEQRNFVFNLAPYLVSRKQREKKIDVPSVRDLEIFRLHTVERLSGRELADRYGLAIDTVFGICWRVRKHHSSGRTDM